MGYIQCCSIPYAPLFIADVAGVNSWTRCSAPPSFLASQFVSPSYSHMWCDNYGDKWFVLISNFMVLECSSSQKRCFLCICLLVISFCDGIMFVSSVLSRWIIWKKVVIWIFSHTLLFESQFSWQSYCFTISPFSCFFPPWKKPP